MNTPTKTIIEALNAEYDSDEAREVHARTMAHNLRGEHDWRAAMDWKAAADHFRMMQGQHELCLAYDKHLDKMIHGRVAA